MSISSEPNEFELSIIKSALENVDLEQQSDWKCCIESWASPQIIDDRFGSESFGEHEAFDRIHLIVEMFDKYVRTHPAIVMRKDTYRLAVIAESLLYKIYQQIYNEAPNYGISNVNGDASETDN